MIQIGFLNFQPISEQKTSVAYKFSSEHQALDVLSYNHSVKSFR